jgi:hypothetical protein
VKEKIVVSVAIVLGVLLLANGVFQLISPEAWYWAVPGVPERGPFNQHFVRDIGIVYSLCGIGLVVGALYSTHRKVLWVAVACWLGGHALFHVWEVWVGICGPASLLEDFAGVTLPALMVIALILSTRSDAAIAAALAD